MSTPTDPSMTGTPPKLLQSLTPQEREIVDTVARNWGGIEQLSVQQINLALDQARAIGDL